MMVEPAEDEFSYVRRHIKYTLQRSIETALFSVVGVVALIHTKVDLDGLKRNMSRGNSPSDELDLSSVLGDTRAYLYSPVLG